MEYSFEILDYKVEKGIRPYMRNFHLWPKNSLFLNDELRLSVSKKELSLRDSYNNNVWQKPIQCPGIPQAAWQSDNRILVTTNTENYHSWGILGPALIIDLEEGRIIKEVRGSHGKPLRDGRFILGLEGYDVFDSWLYDANGELIQQWRSCGHYVINENDDIRVIEQDRTGPTKAQVVRLNLDGSIEKGMKLTTCRASQPILLSDGSIIFENSGILKMSNFQLEETAQLKLLEISERDTSLFRCNIEKIGEHHGLVRIMERSDGRKKQISHKTHEWLIKIKST